MKGYKLPTYVHTAVYNRKPNQKSNPTSLAAMMPWRSFCGQLALPTEKGAGDDDDDDDDDDLYLLYIGYRKSRGLQRDGWSPPSHAQGS